LAPRRISRTGVEFELKSAVSAGFAALVALDSPKVSQWSSKLFYGLVFCELSLTPDVRDPAASTIVSPNVH
jgi:hypothetical protein